MKILHGAVVVLLLSLSLGSCRNTQGATRSVSTPCKDNSCPSSKQHRPYRPKSCLDHLKRGFTKCGVYPIYDNSGNNFPVYCDMNSEPGNAWTLVMSWSNKNRRFYPFRSKGFTQNAPVHENAPKHFPMYRLTHARMQSIKSHSTHWRSTCSFPTKGVDYRDYVRGNFKDFDVMTYSGAGVCKKVEYVNIRGHVGIHTTARWWQRPSYNLHIDSSHKGCGFVPVSGAVSSEDNFGHYGVINPNFRCTANNKATTQWWFGGHL